MGFLERAWDALMSGDGIKAADELQYNEIPWIRPLQGIARSFERMGTEWSITWLDTPNGGLNGRTPRETLSLEQPAGWDRVRYLFRVRDLRFLAHMDEFGTAARKQHQPVSSEDEAMSDTDEGPMPVASEDRSDLYHIPSPELTAAILGARCADARQALGLTVAKAAERCGVAESDLDRFEDGGEICLQDALQVIRALSMSTGFEDAFRMPRFASLDDMLEYAGRTPNSD